MRLFALELNNDLKGVGERKEYIESLIAALPSQDLVLLPELALCSYMPNQKIWHFADHGGRDTSSWAMKMASKYNTFIGVGYLDFEKRDYYNRYLIADGKHVYGSVTKSEGEAAVFRRGWFDSIIRAPFGNIAVAICYDARRRHFYDNVKDEKIALIVFPHGSPANPNKDAEEIASIEDLCGSYLDAFGVPVVYVNSVGKLEPMPGIMGWMMKKAGFKMNGRSRICSADGRQILPLPQGIIGWEVDLCEKKRRREIHFFGQDLTRDNFLFRRTLLRLDISRGIRQYEKAQKRSQSER